MSNNLTSPLLFGPPRFAILFGAFLPAFPLGPLSPPMTPPWSSFSIDLSWHHQLPRRKTTTNSHGWTQHHLIQWWRCSKIFTSRNLSKSYLIIFHTVARSPSRSSKVVSWLLNATTKTFNWKTSSYNALSPAATPPRTFTKKIKISKSWKQISKRLRWHHNLFTTNH